jgi:hypothetical protein
MANTVCHSTIPLTDPDARVLQPVITHIPTIINPLQIRQEIQKRQIINLRGRQATNIRKVKQVPAPKNVYILV